MSAWLAALARMPSPWLVLLLLAVYGLTLSGEFSISDGEVMFQTTVALVHRQELAVPCNPGLPQILPGVEGKCFSKYGLGMPLLAAPAYRIGHFLTRLLAPGTDPIAIGHFAVSALNLVLTALTGLVLYWLARDVYQSRWLGLILALLYGLTTSAWPYTAVFFSEPLVTLLLLVATYALWRLRLADRVGPAWAALAGLALAYAVLTKVATAVVLPLFGLYLLWRLLAPARMGEAAGGTTGDARAVAAPTPARAPAPDNFVRIGPRLAARQASRRPSRRVDPDAINRFPVPLRGGGRASAAAPQPTPAPAPAPTPAVAPRWWPRGLRVGRLLASLAAFGLPLVLGTALLLWHNLVRFGSPFDTGYGDEGFTTPFFVGLYGFLFSSGKSIFLFSPVTLLSLPAFVRFWRRWPAEAALAGGLALATLLYYSAWWAWYGGWSWGPRFLVPILPFLILPLGALLLERHWARWAVVPLALAGVGVQLLGVLIDFNAYIVEIVANDPANEAKYLFYPWLSPLIGHLRYLVKGQHLLGAAFDLTRLGFAPWVARVYPPLVIGTLLGSATLLALIFRPRARRLTGGRS